MPLKLPVIILADGAFPAHPRPLEVLQQAGTLICCDGAADHLRRYPRQPDIVIGDLDSISDEAREAYATRLIYDPSQQRSDLEKAIQWAAEQGAGEVTILGATGLRDDHSFGNLLMLWLDYGVELTIMTATGIFTVVRERRSYRSFPGQIVALYPESTGVKITTNGLAYSLEAQNLTARHRGTSNASTADSFSVDVEGGPVIIYQGHGG